MVITPAAAYQHYPEMGQVQHSTSFAVGGPRVWNSLPANLRDEDITYTSFRRELKTYWFFAAGAQCDVLNCAIQIPELN